MEPSICSERREEGHSPTDTQYRHKEHAQSGGHEEEHAPQVAEEGGGEEQGVSVYKVRQTWTESQANWDQVHCHYTEVEDVRGRPIPREEVSKSQGVPHSSQNKTRDQ